MNYDGPLPFAVSQYREVQRLIPGVEGLYRAVRAILEVEGPVGGLVLAVGAGGGRELETLGPSAKGFSFVAVDPSAAMLDLARERAAALRLADRTRFVHGEIDAAPLEPGCDAATSLLVMHFLPDDGAKLAYLRAVRARLKPDAPFVLADASVEDRSAFERMRPVFLAHAELVGLPPEAALGGAGALANMPLIDEARTRALLHEAGFSAMTPFFRALWYAGWWARAS
jgi:tRNA (cmo5U34)-methyltransferase